MKYSMQELNEIFNINEIMSISSTILIIGGVVSFLLLVELFFIFKKFGEKGWKVLIPIYNTWIFFELADLPGWLEFIPVANIIGTLIAPFILAKKAGKSALLGLISLISPHIFYLIILLSKNKNTSEEFIDTKEEVKENNNNNEETLIIEKQENTLNIDELNNKAPEFIEEPALNTEESVQEETTALNNSYVSIENENKKVIDEDITNAFEIPPIIEEREKTDTLDILSNQSTNNFINSGEPLMPTYEELESLDLNEPPALDKDILEETVELPKMANVEINNDITATKKCYNCGFENEYSSKSCLMCGEPLE